MLESLFDKVAACYVIKKDANTDVSFKICKIFKIIYFEEHLLTAVSAAREKTVKFYLRLSQRFFSSRGSGELKIIVT